MLTATLLLFMVAGCSTRKAAENREKVADTLTNIELPVPEIPDNLESREDKVDFVVARFWDAMDFKNTALSHSEPFIEQNFVNFITLFPYATQESIEEGVKNLIKGAEADSIALRLVAKTADLYLYEPNSPYLSEDYYLVFLRELTKSTRLDGAIRERFKWQLESAMKNRPGDIAADFSFRTRDGRNFTFHSWKPDADKILLIFYNPDCDQCKETLQYLMADEEVNRQIANKELSILAIDAGYDEDLWKTTAGLLPATWTVGFEKGDIEEKELYVLRALPSLYLLDRDKKVIEKDIRFGVND